MLGQILFKSDENFTSIAMFRQKALKRGSRLYRIVYLNAVHSPVRKTPLRNGFA